MISSAGLLSENVGKAGAFPPDGRRRRKLRQVGLAEGEKLKSDILWLNKKILADLVLAISFSDNRKIQST